MNLAGIHSFARPGQPVSTIADQMAALMQQAGARLMAIRRCSSADDLDRLIAAGAWTDAALKLLSLECPQWRVRRLVYDDGEWHCALSRNRETPDWLDQSAEASHADMAMAILRAITAAQEDMTSRRSSVPDVPRRNIGKHGSEIFEPMCCDNFL